MSADSSSKWHNNNKLIHGVTLASFGEVNKCKSFVMKKQSWLLCFSGWDCFLPWEISSGKEHWGATTILLCLLYCTWSPSARKFLSPEAGYSRCWINQDRPHVSRPSTPTQHASPAEICAVSEKHSELAHMVLKSWNSAVSFIRLFPTWSWTQCGGETFRPPVPAVLRMPSVLCCCCQHPQVWI